MLKRAATMVAVALAISGCSAFSTLTHGLRQAKATESDLQATLGVKPDVGFSWSNGFLTSVEVSFPERPAGRTLDEIAAATRAAVAKEFGQRPTEIRLTFAIQP